MSESKELLEATVKGLQDKLELLQAELNIKTLELENVSKTKLTEELYDEIGSAIEDAVEGFNFDDPEAYEFDLAMEYDGKVYVDSVGMQATYELTNSIMAKIDKRFNVLPTSTEENTITEAQKVV